MSAILIGFGLDEEALEQNAASEVYQTLRFSRSLIALLRSVYEDDLVLYLTRPAPPWPKGPFFVGGGGGEKVFMGGESLLYVKYIPYLNIRCLREITRFIYTFSIILFCRSKVRRSKDLVCYSVYLPFLFCAWLFSIVYRFRLIGVFTDPPSVGLATDGALIKKLRVVELSISRFLLRSFDGAIVLSKYLAEDFNIDKYIVVEGLVDAETDSIVNRSFNDRPLKLIYAGALSIDSGIDNLANVVACLPPRCVELHVFGFGALSVVLDRVSGNATNVHFYGSVPNNVVLTFYEQCHVGVMVRDHENPVYRYAFPSKITEYLMHGLLIFTTPLAGISKAVLENCFVTANNSEKEIDRALRSLLKVNSYELAYISKSQRRLACKLHYKYQALRIKEFLCQV